MCRTVKPGDAAVCAITGNYPGERPNLGDDYPDFARTDEFNGPDYSHRYTETGPKGTAIASIHTDGTYTVVDKATGNVTYSADLRRSDG